MRSRLLLILAAFLFATAAQAAPWARIETTMGTMVVELDADKAPVTVKNFVRYAREGHYNGTVFYRVVKGFVLQAGSFKAGGVYKPAKHKPIPLETATGLSNVRGAVAMAREETPASARAEFFIDLDDVNATALDPKPGDPPNTTGYAVFGHVVQGMDVVDQIAAVPVGGGKGPFPEYEPKTPVVIQKVTIEDTPPLAPPDALATPEPVTPDPLAPAPSEPDPAVPPDPTTPEPATPDPAAPSPEQ